MTTMEKSKYYWIRSHNNASNDSPWHRSNLFEFDAKTEKIMKLIDGDEVESFAKRAEALYVKKPELIAMIQDIYCMYSSLMFRYNSLKKSDSKTQLNCKEDSLSENYEVSEVDDDDGEKEINEEIERLRRENKVFKEVMREKDEEKREIIRQLSMTIDMLKSENFEIKKNLSIRKTKKKQNWNSLGFVKNPLEFVKSKLGFIDGSKYY